MFGEYQPPLNKAQHNDTWYKTLGIMTISNMKLGVTTLSVMTISITTLGKNTT